MPILVLGHKGSKSWFTVDSLSTAFKGQVNAPFSRDQQQPVEKDGFLCLVGVHLDLPANLTQHHVCLLCGLPDCLQAFETLLVYGKFHSPCVNFFPFPALGFVSILTP